MFSWSLIISNHLRKCNLPNETPFVFAFYFKSKFLYTLIQYCMTLTQNPTGAKGGAVPLALHSFWSTTWTSNRIWWTLKGRYSFPSSLFPHFCWLWEKDKNKEILPVIHFLWPHSRSAASQSFLVFAFHVKVSNLRNFTPTPSPWGQRWYMFFCSLFKNTKRPQCCRITCNDFQCLKHLAGNVSASTSKKNRK